VQTRWVTILTAAMLVLTGFAAAVGGELTVRTCGLLEWIQPGKFPEAATSSGPIGLVGVRNGAFAGQVVVGSTESLEGLKAVASDLQGPGTIPASAVTIRYGVPDGPKGRSERLGLFDSLESVPPARVRTYKRGGVVQPVWITVSVPADAKPGNYAGTVTISADGATSVTMPLKVKVIDWTLPDANTFTPHMDIVQSPESVARAYEVEQWSAEHVALLDQTFALLKPLAVKTIYISAIRRTHFGNEHAMVRWYRDENGGLKPNFDVVEKYLDVATKHLGKVPAVILYCWEPISSMGHAGGTGGAGRSHDKPIQFTLWDPKTGRLKKRTGPAWGSPEARTFWKRLTDGIQPILAERGLEKSMMFGLIGDARPTKVAMDDICNGVENAKWAIHSHHYAPNWQGYEIGMCVALWGIHLNIADPEQGRGYGWQNPSWLAYYPREFALNSPLPQYRYKLEMWLGALSLFEMKHKGTTRTARGLGRIGGDFWIVLKDGRGRLRHSLAGRYPESYWGQLNLNYCIPHLLGKGQTGPVPTVRSEAFREGIQEAEARVFIEKAIVPEEKRSLVGEDLVKRCRAMLDERIRLVNQAGGSRQDQRGRGGQVPKGPPDWTGQAEKLYALAAEVAKKLGT